MNQTLHIELDSDVFLGMQRDQESMAAEMRLAAAIKWYECAMLTQEKAASVAGLSRSDFMAALSRYQVSPFQETPTEIITMTTGREKLRLLWASKFMEP